VEKMEQVEDITAIAGPPVSATEEVIPLATPVSSTVGEESLHDRHMAEVTPPSPTMAFQMVVRDPPPLAIIAPGFPPDGQRSAPLAPDVAETADRVGVIHGSNEHEVSVPPPHVSSLATDRADHHEGGSMNKKDVKLKKRNDRG
jgi:hypothetical protein